MRALTTDERRYLARLACLMMEGASLDLEIKLRNGGVFDFKEIAKVKACDLGGIEDRFIDAMTGASKTPP